MVVRQVCWINELLSSLITLLTEDVSKVFYNRVID